MRYIINTQDQEGVIGMQIKRWAEEGKLTIIEKADLAVELQAQLEKVAKALETLKKAGYNSDVMKTYIGHKLHIARPTIDAIFKSQEDFFRQIGVLK